MNADIDRANPGHGLEVLHASWMLEDMLENYIFDTIWVANHPELQGSIENAAKALADLYQAIGNTIPEETPND